MYTTHFGLTAPPFSITPDPHYLYLSEHHREALAHLLYGASEGSGFVLLTGEVGTGKTTLCRCLIEQLPDNIDVALLLNPRLSPQELLASLFDELRIQYDRSFTLKDFIDTLNTYLLTAHAVGRRTVLILDEAQNLSTEVLEQIRLLTNLETENEKLLQIILVGQPELQKLLKLANLRQLAQRITARYHLLPLSLRDTEAYVSHRLSVSGSRLALFPSPTIRQIYRYSKGIPRLINVICDRALLGAYVDNKPTVDTAIVHKSVREIHGEPINYYPKKLLLAAMMASILMVIGLLGWHFFPTFKIVYTDYIAQLAVEEEIAQENTEVNTTQPLAVTENTTEVKNTEEEQVETIELDNEALLSNTEKIVVIPEEIEVLTEEEKVIKPVADAKSIDLLTLLQSGTVPTNIENAFVSLFKYWELDYNQLSGIKACERAATKGLACIARTGSWRDIRSLNRPAVIELVIPPNTQYHVTVTALKENDIAVLDFNGQTFEYSFETIGQYWLGQYLILWQPPALPVPVLRKGMKKEAVKWLKQKFAIIDGKPLTNANISGYFNNKLKRRVINFQHKHGLSVDGVAGEQTLLLLDSLSSSKPKLY